MKYDIDKDNNNEQDNYPFIGSDIDKERILRDKQATWNRINTDINKKSRRVLFQKIAASAASILIIISIGFIFFQPNTKEMRWTCVEVPMGKIDSILLADGSKVILNGGSKLYYPDAFREEVRKVVFHGEGYFDVHTDRNHPFVINCDEIDIKVLGTKFNLKSYSSDNFLEAKLESGRIQAIHQTTKRVVDLIPGEMVIYDKEAKTFGKESFDKSYISGWAGRKFHFKGIPFIEIAKSLERGFGVTFIVENESLKNKKVTANFASGESIEDIMTVLGKVSGLNYLIMEDTIIIKSNDTDVKK